MDLTRFLVATIIIGAITGCDRSQSSYDSAADARRAGAFDRGWFPAFIPQDARDLYEFHHIDDHWTWGSFRLPSRSHDWTTGLRAAVDTENIRIRRPPRGVRWPEWLVEEITAADLQGHGYQVFVHREREATIHENTVYVFVSVTSDTVYFHREPSPMVIGPSVRTHGATSQAVTCRLKSNERPDRAAFCVSLTSSLNKTVIQAPPTRRPSSGSPFYVLF